MKQLQTHTHTHSEQCVCVCSSEVCNRKTAQTFSGETSKPQLSSSSSPDSALFQHVCFQTERSVLMPRRRRIPGPQIKLRDGGNASAARSHRQNSHQKKKQKKRKAGASEHTHTCRQKEREREHPKTDVSFLLRLKMEGWWRDDGGLKEGWWRDDGGMVEG